MRRTIAPLLMLMLLLLGAGCATNPVDRYYEIQSSANAARNTILEAHETGVVNDRELLALDALEKAARTSLEAVRAKLPRDEEGNLDPDGEVDAGGEVEWYLDQAERTLDALISHFEDLQQKGANDERSRDPGGGEDDGGDRGSGPGIRGLDRDRSRVGRAERPPDARAA